MKAIFFLPNGVAPPKGTIHYKLWSWFHRTRGRIGYWLSDAVLKCFGLDEDA